MTTASTSSKRPEDFLEKMFLDMLSPDDMRRLARGLRVDKELPASIASQKELATALTRLILDNGLLDPLWPEMRCMRVRRVDEIENIRQAVEKARKAIKEAEQALEEAAQGVDPDEIPAPPVRVLFVSSVPRYQAQLAIEAEMKKIQEGINVFGGRFAAHWTPAATYEGVRDALRAFKPHILHIACHGTPDARLLFSTDQGDVDSIAAATFGKLLALRKQEDNLRLVVLNACDSATSVGPVAAAVELVVGMEGRFRDSSAVVFSNVFYKALGGGDTVEVAFGEAVNELERRDAEATVPQLFPPEGPQRKRRFVRV